MLSFLLFTSTNSVYLVTSYIGLKKCQSIEIPEPNLLNWERIDYNIKIYVKMKQFESLCFVIDSNNWFRNLKLLTFNGDRLWLIARSSINCPIRKYETIWLLLQFTKYTIILVSTYLINNCSVFHHQSSLCRCLMFLVSYIIFFTVRY